MAMLQLEPDFVVDETGAVSSGPVVVDKDRIVAVGASHEGAERVALPGRFLTCGFVNAHSHAFQRALRGRVEERDGAGEGAHDDFWTWRQLMYEAALALDLDALEAVAAWAYADMLKSGFVAVGEFHYVHHDRDGAPYPDGAAVSRRLARAAERTGVRAALLQTAYARAGHGAPPTDGQRRFVFADAAAFLEHARDARAIQGARVSHGLAIHSVRACPRDWIEALAREADAEDLPLHAHACEQPAEIAACREEHGVAPLALLESAGALSARSTIVHATHLEPDDAERLGRSGAGVCVCPSTERNLGDGLCPIADLQAAGVPLSVGTDSHARIDVVDELRSLEDHERLRLQRRNVLVPPAGSLRQAVLPAGTTAGARALGLSPPGLSPGARADLVAVTTPIEGAAHEAAAVDAWLVGGSGRDVSDVWVAGERVVADGRLSRADEAELYAAAREVLVSLTARG
jgi:formimidoylglutamate deiminase